MKSPEGPFMTPLTDTVGTRMMDNGLQSQYYILRVTPLLYFVYFFGSTGERKAYEFQLLSFQKGLLFISKPL